LVVGVVGPDSSLENEVFSGFAEGKLSEAAFVGRSLQEPQKFANDCFPRQSLRRDSRETIVKIEPILVPKNAESIDSCSVRSSDAVLHNVLNGVMILLHYISFDRIAVEIVA
jgi:hypothetical protein